MIQEKFGTFEIIEQVGEGATSVVYRARQDKEPREIALKINKTELNYADSFLGRFGSEMKVASSLVHPGICRVFASGREANRAYVVLEFIDGMPLSEVIEKKGRISTALAYAVGERLAEALSYAHSREVVHRDIKPDNVMVNETGLVKILDFGLARKGSTSGSDNFVVGTPSYMAPEQARGEVVDERADVYSLGAVLYHALTGRAPFEGPDPLDVVRQVGSTKPPSIDDLAPQAPEALRTVVKRAMAPLPQRYFSADLLLTDLRCAREGRPLATTGSSLESGSTNRLALLIVGVLLALTAWLVFAGHIIHR